MARGCGPIVVLLALAVASHAGATTRPAPVEAPVEHFVLPNGLTVLLATDHKAPLIGMQLRYRVGTRDEPESRPGLAGLVQRLMMRATMHLGEGDYDRYLDGAGGFDSGWRTAVDQSISWVTVPAEEVALPLWLWSDQMGFFASTRGRSSDRPAAAGGAQRTRAEAREQAGRAGARADRGRALPARSSVPRRSAPGHGQSQGVDRFRAARLRRVTLHARPRAAGARR